MRAFEKTQTDLVSQEYVQLKRRIGSWYNEDKGAMTVSPINGVAFTPEPLYELEHGSDRQ